MDRKERFFIRLIRNVLLLVFIIGAVIISGSKVYAAEELYEAEDNDTADTANDISLGSYVYGDMKNKEDTDYYKFQVNDTGVVDITLSHADIDQGFSFFVTVYQYSNGSYTELNSDMIWAPGVYHLTLGTAPNTYYVKVNAGAIASVNGKYVMSVNFTKSADWERELNDSTETANDINIGSLVYGSMKRKDDTDYYKFSLSQPATVQVGLAHTDINQGFSFSAAVYQYKNGSYTKIAESSSIWAPEKYQSPELRLSAGSYYISVSAGANGSVGGKYTLDLDYKVSQTSIRDTSSTQKSKVKINYKKVPNVTGYEIYRKTKGNYVRIKTISNNNTLTYTDKNVKGGQTYYYKVRAYYKAGSKVYYGKFSGTKKIIVKK